MTFKQLMDLYDDWNGFTRVNDDSLNKIVEDRTRDIVEKRSDLLDLEVVSFGFQEEGFYYILTVRVDTKDDESFTKKEDILLENAMKTFEFDPCHHDLTLLSDLFISTGNKIKRKLEKERKNE